MQSNKTILVVEDEPIVRKVCARVLRNHGFEPIEAMNGMEGLKAYGERHTDICLVLSDVSMPLMGGIEMSRRMFEVYSHANVILMSGANLCDLIPDDIRRLCSVLEKPFTPANLIVAVKKCLKYEAEHHPSIAVA